MTEVRYALITAMRRQGMTWREIATEFHVRDVESFGETYRRECLRRETAPIVQLLRKVGAAR